MESPDGRIIGNPFLTKSDCAAGMCARHYEGLLSDACLLLCSAFPMCVGLSTTSQGPIGPARGRPQSPFQRNPSCS